MDPRPLRKFLKKAGGVAQNTTTVKPYYFFYYGNKVMTYTMVKNSAFKFPTERYVNIVKRGYLDCKLDKSYLLKALRG